MLHLEEFCPSKNLNEKVELQEFSKHDDNFLSAFIIKKIENGDFIKI